MNLPTKRIGDHPLPLPKREREGDSGLDLRASLSAAPVVQVLPHPKTGDMTRCWEIEPGRRVLIGCGFAFAIPRGFEGQVRLRSGLSSKGIYCAFGTIDATYRGEVGIMLTNMSDEPFIVWDGDRIAQLVVAPIAQPVPEEVTELDSTERGANGFGSSGTR